MGEANPRAIALIREITAHDPRYGTTANGEQCLHIGDIVIVATSLALWSDPSVWPGEDGSLTITWGGRHVVIIRDASGQWRVQDSHADLLLGKARFVT